MDNLQQNAISRITLEAIAADSIQNLIFKILNRTIEVCHYDRATLWDVRRGRCRPLGISGTSGFNKNSEFLHRFKKLLQANPSPTLSRIVTAETFGPQASSQWQELSGQMNGLQLVWLVLCPWGKPTTGILLERWDGRAWEQQDLAILNQLAFSYESALERLKPQTFWRRNKHLLLSNISFLLLVAALAGFLLFYRMPLRIVAPCDVVPKNPIVVSAPINGVIAEVMITPYQNVEKDQPLVAYDRRIVEEELNLARQQVLIITSELNRTKLQAMTDPAIRQEIEILKSRLDQEKIRVDLAEYRVSKLAINAPVGGTAVIDDPDAWRGRPVVIGEKILTIVTPGSVKIRVWLPVDDNIDFDFNHPVKVILHALPDSSKTADLKYVGRTVVNDPRGGPVILAEAQFRAPSAEIKAGLKGSAVLYGHKVRLAYWVMRKPLATFRRLFGI